MDLYQDGNFRVNRDEARLFKDAARTTANLPLVKACAHYLGTRLTMGPTQHIGRRIPRVTMVEYDNALDRELRALPAHVERITPGVSEMRYVYGPELAKLAIDTLQQADTQHLLTPEQQKLATEIRNDYDQTLPLEQRS